MDFRRIGLLVVAVVVAVVCVRLGIWQLDRWEGRRAANDRVRAGLREPVAPLEELLKGTVAPEDLAWRPAEVSGDYDPDEEVILYGRTQDGRPGDHVLTPLLLADGTAVVVDRGWIPFEPEQDPPVSGPAAAPDGLVSITGVVLAPGSGAVAGEAPVGVTGPVTIVRQVDLGVLQRQVPYELAPVALQLREQRPEQTAGLPEPAPLPELDEGPHLSYAIQWFAFAAIAVVGYVLLVRRDRHTVTTHRPEEGVS
ncbi:MAG: SURF1 family cytochrome oxidase biogenesis protein [Actinomycetota bacterium]